MKNLALVFCSIRPQQLNSNVCSQREVEYYNCIKQIKRIIPDSFNLIVCENTINHPEEIQNLEVREYFSDLEIISLGSDDNIGKKNKGCGEILMLYKALQEIDLENYNNISYVTGRRMWTCPYAFEKTEQTKYDAIMVQNDHVYLNGIVRCNERNNFNDTYFSMKSSLMKDYSDYSMNRLNELSEKHISSEVNLFDFVKEKNINYELLNWLGLIRNDWERSGNPLDINNFHFC
jgi:hypothetical protein